MERLDRGLHVRRRLHAERPGQGDDPFLNDVQKKIWRSTTRGQSIFFGGIGFIGGMVGGFEEVEVLGDAPVEVPLQEAKQADAKQEEKKKP